jgi:hypothetical protein
VEAEGEEQAVEAAEVAPLLWWAVVAEPSLSSAGPSSSWWSPGSSSSVPWSSTAQWLWRAQWTWFAATRLRPCRSPRGHRRRPQCWPRSMPLPPMSRPATRWAAPGTGATTA